MSFRLIDVFTNLCYYLFQSDIELREEASEFRYL